MISSNLQRVLDFVHFKEGDAPQIVDRVSTESWVWDGNSIASKYYGEADFEKYPNRSRLKFDWNDSLFKEEKNRIPHIKNFTDMEILHEICHWIAAEISGQRNRIEFHLNRGHQMVDPMAWGSIGEGFRDKDGLIYSKIIYFKVKEGMILPFRECLTQEFTTQMLTIFLGAMFNIPLSGKSWPTDWENFDWEEYRKYKQENEWVWYTSESHDAWIRFRRILRSWGEKPWFPLENSKIMFQRKREKREKEKRERDSKSGVFETTDLMFDL